MNLKARGGICAICKEDDWEEIFDSEGNNGLIQKDCNF